MAVAMETLIREHQSMQVTELNEFLVPKILGANLKKKVEDRSKSSAGSDDDRAREDGRDISKQSKLSENVQKNFCKIVDHETTPPEPVVDSVRRNEDEEEEDASEMAPERQRDKGSEKQSSYLLQPFLKPVAQRVEGSPAENPILKALFGVGNAPHNGNQKTLYSWVTDNRPPSNSCHPFKKTELSRDIVNDSTPVQVPKSLMRDRQKSSPKAATGPKRSSESRALKESAPPEPSVVETATWESPPRQKSKTSQDKENRKPGTPEDVANQALCKVSSSKGRIGSLTSLKKMGYVNSEKLMKLRSIVDNAIKNHKVYSMTGCYNSVRNALKQRGWIEKIDSDIKGKRRQNRFEEIGLYDAAFQFVQKYPTLAAMRYSIQSQSGFYHNDQINYSGQGEAEIINRMLRNINEDLCWLSRPYPYYCWKDIGKFDLVNRLPKAYFSNKIGLCNSLQHIQWYFEPGVCSTQYPRTYNMSQKDEYEAFKDDFRMTACISLLKWLTVNYRSGGERAVRSVEGKVDASIVDFALKRCTEYIKYKEHEDIDLPEGVTVWEYQWDHFITQYYKIINDGHLLKECKGDPSIQVYVTNALATLNLIKNYWPQINIDGYQNFWVVKPGGRCCGNGIVIKNNLEHILMMVHPTATRETRYVVQKYIERPLLIYNTKFDIRQWFLVTSVYPLTVWMYKESYLRFCSQPFSLKNTHESIHLCNNAVQRRYKNSKRDRGLPDENMWDCYTFQTYLKSIGQPDAWEKYIYPGMKEGFIGALLASQDTMERRKNCFELYGADFMISDTLTDGPWLIEINSNPAMDSSTSVTARMCPQVLEDIVKVVIDRRDDKNASTGAFEMVYKQHCPPVPPYLGMSLSIKGQKVHRVSAGEPKQCSKKSKSPNSCGKFLQSETEDSEDQCDPTSAHQLRARAVGRDFLATLHPGSDALNRQLLAPNFTSEMLEGLKKEILRAKLSVRTVIARDDPPPDGDEDSRTKIPSRRASDEKLEAEQTKLKVRTPERRSSESSLRQEVVSNGDEIQVTCVNDEINIVAPKIISCTDGSEQEDAGDEVREEESELARKSSKGRLPRIAESRESVREDIARGELPEGPYGECESEPQQSCIVEICPHQRQNIAVGEVHPILYVTTYEEKRTAFSDGKPRSIPAESTEDGEEEPGEKSEDYEKYIIKKEVEKKMMKKAVARKTSWKVANSSHTNRLDYKRRWKEGKKKVNFVLKNIQDVRGMQDRPRPTFRVYNTRSLSYRVYPMSRNSVEAKSSEYEDVYQEELLKMLRSMDSKKFVQQLCGSRLKYWMRYLSTRREADGRKAASRSRSGIDVYRRDGAKWKANDSDSAANSMESVKCESSATSFEVPPICSEIAVQLGISKETVQERPSSEAMATAYRYQGISCPNLNFAEREQPSDDNLPRDFTDAPPRNELKATTTTELKANLEVARRACSDILAKLREFNESNSKVRLQQALRKGSGVDTRGSDAIKAYRTAKGRKHLRRSEGEERAGEGLLPRGSTKPGLGSRRREQDEASVGGLRPQGLAISTENGAVRRVDRGLPKLRSWTVVDKPPSSFGWTRRE